MVDSSDSAAAGRERGLVELAKSGDDEAFGRLFDRHRSGVYRLALHRLGDPILAEDVVQETFLRARSKLCTFDPSRRLFPWLASIALNRAADLWEKERRLQPAGLEPPQLRRAGCDTTWATVAQITERSRIRRAMGRLSPSQRRALLLHDLDGVGYRELAALEGTTELAVRSLVFRARAAMRSALRTLGLLTWALRRRLARRPPGSPAPSIAAANLVSMAVASIALALTFAGGAGVPASATRASTGRPGPSVVGAGGSDLANRAAPSPGHDAQPVVSEQSGAALVHWTATVASPRPSTAAPGDGKLTLEVVGPDGDVLYYNHTWIECRDVGKPPAAGPFQSVC